jgi:hypothetical protein
MRWMDDLREKPQFPASKLDNWLLLRCYEERIWAKIMIVL